VELDEDEDIDIENGHQQQSGSDVEGDAGEHDEVSINLEDAIATAEEINKAEQLMQGRDSEENSEIDQEGVDDSGIMIDEDGNPHYIGDADSKLIAGIVTDGHNEKDGFDQMREE